MMQYIVTGIFILLDFITGIIKAFKQHNFTSSVMREGLFHKAGSLIIILLSALVDYSQKYIDIGINKEVSVAVCTYIIIMEIASVIENVGKINPELIPKQISKFFKKL